MPDYSTPKINHKAFEREKAKWRKHYLAKGVTTKLDKLVSMRLHQTRNNYAS